MEKLALVKQLFHIGLAPYPDCYSRLGHILGGLCPSAAAAILAVAPPFGHLVIRSSTQPLFRVPTVRKKIATKWLSRSAIIEDAEQLPNEVFDRRLLRSLGLSHVIIVRLPVTDTSVLDSMLPLRPSDASLPALGVVVVAVSSPSEAAELAQRLEQVSALLSSALLASIQSTERSLRARVVSNTLPKRDINSVLNSVLSTVRELLPFEGGSIFLWDSRRRLLQLHATTGLKEARRRNEVFYRVGESRITVGVAESGQTSVTDSIRRDHTETGKFEESVVSDRQSFLAIPILGVHEVAAPEGTAPLGVFRLINRSAEFGYSQPVPFGWDDQCIYRFAAELAGVIVTYMWRAREAQDHFERVIHGIKANIGAVALNLGHLQHHPELVEFKHDSFRYILPDSLALTRDIHWQVERNIGWYRDRFETDAPNSEDMQDVKLLGEVLAKIKGIFPEMTRVQNSGAVTLEYADYESFTKLPVVVGSSKSLHTVFRNLIENALKYTNASAPERKIILGQRLVPGYVEILVDDNGIGVPVNEEEWIFVDGYRCDNAMRRRPGGGGGIGLAQSRQLMDDMGGELYLERVDGLTRFVVRVRTREGTQ